MSMKSLNQKIHDLTREVSSLEDTPTKARLEAMVASLRNVAESSSSEGGEISADVPKAGTAPPKHVFGDGYLICC